MQRNAVTSFLRRNAGPFIVFAVSFTTYSVYLFGRSPGYYSLDVYELIEGLFRLDSLSSKLELVVAEAGGSTSAFYRAYVLLFHLVTENLVALGVFQVLLLSIVNGWAWHVVRKYSEPLLAWVVVSLTVLSPVIGFLPGWYHRSSLFAGLVYLNLVLLYKFSRTWKFNRAELVIFVSNLTLIAFIRTDGAVIFLASLVIFALRDKSSRWTRLTLSLAAISIVAAHTLLPSFSDKSLPYPVTYQTYPAVRRIHQCTGGEFSPEDERVLNSVVRLDADRFDRELWLEGKNYVDYDVIKDDAAPEDVSSYIQWSRRFIVRNLPCFMLTQTEVWYHSSLLGTPRALYFHDNSMFTGQPHYRRVRAPNEPNRGSLNTRVNRLYEFLSANSAQRASSNLTTLLAALLFGTAIPFTALVVFSVIAVIRRRALLAPILPLLLYGLFILTFQPQPKAYYWSWLACTYYFIVFVFGHDLLSRRTITESGSQPAVSEGPTARRAPPVSRERDPLD